MQPPRPFPGAQYDKDMFTFLPARPNRDVLVESPTRRKQMASDHQIVMPAPTVGYGLSGITGPQLKAVDIRGKEPQNSYPVSAAGESAKFRDYSAPASAPREPAEFRDYSAPASAPREPAKFRDYYDNNGYSDGPTMGYGLSEIPGSKLRNVDLRNKEPQNFGPASAPGESAKFRDYSDNNGYPDGPSSWTPNKRDFHQTKPEYTGYSSFNGPFVSSYHKDSSPSFHMSAGPNRKTSTWPLPVTKDCENRVNDAHVDRQGNVVAREENARHFQELQSFGQQKPVHMKAEGSDSHEQASYNLGKSQSLQQDFLNPGAFVVGLDRKACHHENYKVESSSNIKGSDDACSFARLDSDKMLGKNVADSGYNLQHETNTLLQNALRLLSASGIGLDSLLGNIQGCGGDDKTKKLMPYSDIQNPEHSPIKTTLSKNVEGGPNCGTPGVNGEKSSVILNKERQSENGTSALTEKLWDGTLQLSSSSASVSAIAYFKSGEKMHDFSWPGSVEVKGKVRLEAFEKYVQDLPRSRTRGLMVMSLCSKEGSSDAGHKGMKEVARKYKEGKKVGFAQLSSGVDLYICPHSDTIITILAKHGFFKGMTAVIDKSDPLIGCVVWRKNASSVPITKTAEINGPQSGTVISPSHSSSAQQAPTESSTSANENQGPKTDVELNKAIRPLPPVVALNQSVATDDDDDDLPEFDFRAAISQMPASKTLEAGEVESRLEARPLNDSHIPKPILAQKGSESSATLSPLPVDLHNQILTPQNTGHHQPTSHIPSSKPPDSHFQGQVPQNQQEKPIGMCEGGLKRKSLFDDDDMPEWTPPEFTKRSKALPERDGPASSARLPPLPPGPPPPRPPLNQQQFRDKYYPSSSSHLPSPIADNPPKSGFTRREPGFSRTTPPPPPRPPPLTQQQFQDKDYPSSSHLPSPIADNPSKSSFTRREPGFSRTTAPPPPNQLQVQDKDRHSSPHILPHRADNPAVNGFTRNKNPEFPPGFAPNQGFGPRFDPPGVKNPIRPSVWRRPRP